MTDSSGPPTDRRLLELAADDWSIVLGHVRAVLNGLDDKALDVTVRRLRSAPAGRLAGGRMRRDLVHLVTSRPGIWSDVRERLTDDPAAGGLRWLVDGLPAPTPPPTRNEAPPASAKGDDDRRARQQRRLAEVRDERDALRRQLDGATARAERAEARATELAANVAGLEADLEGLRSEIEAERERTTTAVEREQRRHTGRISELEDELTKSRRQLDRIQQERRAAARSRAAAAGRRDRGDQPAPIEESGDVAPGRPSRLPAGLRLDTTEGAAALLQSAGLVFVDGWNVTKTNWAKLPFDQHRQRLRGALERAAARYDVEVVVVYDGQGDGDQARARRVLQVFTPGGTTADDDLLFRTAALPEDEPIVVVTDDAELRRRLSVHAPDLLHTRPFLWAIQ